MEIVKVILRAVWTGVKIILKSAFLLPVPLFMLYVNFNVDRSGIFHGDRYNREQALLLIDGQVLNDYDTIDERGVLALLAENIEQPFDTVALGSSRVLMMRHEQAGGGSYMNAGVSGCDLYDMLGTLYLFDRAGMMPRHVVVCPDPWVLDANYRNVRSDIDLYNEFLSERLGMDTGFVPPDTTAALSALIDPSYFQGNLEYWFSDKSGEERPPVVPAAEVLEQDVSVKLGDGSVLYARAYRSPDAEELDTRARIETNTFLIHSGFTRPDAEMADIFDRFLGYLHGQGVEVSLLLPPYSPLIYNFTTENAAALSGVFAAEDWFRECAAKYGYPVYGSYNPFVNDFRDDDFYDGLHPKPETIGAVYPGVAEAARAQGAPYKWRHLGGAEVSWETAERLVAERYEIPPAEPTLPGGDETINGQRCHIVERWDKQPEETPAGDEGEPAGGEEPPAVRLARYAVSVEGVIYRYDDAAGWVVDLRFPP